MTNLAVVMPVVLFALSVTACGGGNDSSNNQDAGIDGSNGGVDAGTETGQVGAAGGTLELNGVTLVVPAGAVDSDVTIGVSRIEGAGGDVAYELTPAGTIFAAPIEVTVPLAGVTDPEFFLTDFGDTTTLRTVESAVVGTSVTASINHFSYVCLGEKCSVFDDVCGCRVLRENGEVCEVCDSVNRCYPSQASGCTAENCTNQTDDDGDGAVDCLDRECLDDQACAPAATCGNEQLDEPELCDGNCPEVCTLSQDACVRTVLAGWPETCNAQCTTVPRTECSDVPDECCPAGCSQDTDPDCLPAGPGDACNTTPDTCASPYDCRETVFFPNGVCTESCNIDGDCSPAGECLNDSINPKHCNYYCQTNDDCQPGYECLESPVTPPNKLCFVMQ